MATTIELKDNDKPTSAGVRDVNNDVSELDTVNDTVGDVSTQFRHHEESDAASETRSSTELTVPFVEPSCHQHSQAISLLLWKLTELERRVTLGQVYFNICCESCTTHTV